MDVKNVVENGTYFSCGKYREPIYLMGGKDIGLINRHGWVLIKKVDVFITRSWDQKRQYTFERTNKLKRMKMCKILPYETGYLTIFKYMGWKHF